MFEVRCFNQNFDGVHRRNASLTPKVGRRPIDGGLSPRPQDMGKREKLIQLLFILKYLPNIPDF